MKAKNLWITAALLILAALLGSLAWIMIELPVSKVLIVLGAIIFLFGVFYFTLYFRE